MLTSLLRLGTKRRCSFAPVSATSLWTPPPRRSYHENVVDHYENPRNVGSLDKDKKNVGTGLVGAPACGDVMKLQIEVDDQGVVVGELHGGTKSMHHTDNEDNHTVFNVHLGEDFGSLISMSSWQP